MANFLNRIGLVRPNTMIGEGAAAEVTAPPPTLFQPTIIRTEYDETWQHARLLKYYVEFEEYMKASRASGMPDTLIKMGGSPNPLPKRKENYSRRRSANIAIHVTPQEKNMIRTKAERAQMTVTDYIIKTVEDDEIVVCDELVPLLIELKRIGNNINQIAYKANCGVIVAVEMTETKQELAQIREQIEKIARKIYGNS